MRLNVTSTQVSKARYLLTSAWRYVLRNQTACLNCGASGNPVEERKVLVTQLRRCQSCKLLYRTPTDDPRDNERFYDSEYVAGLATRMPSETELEQLKASLFRGTSKDFSYHIECLKRCGLTGEGQRLFDFGCSWGYASYQFAQAGFQVTGYEVAPTRRSYAHQQLGVDVVDYFEGLASDERFANSFDCFFSSHVLEHVPFPSRVITEACSLLKPGGLFVALIPNGSVRRRAHDKQWSQHWGKVHPNYLDEVFLDHQFSNWPRLFASSRLYRPMLPVDVVNFPDDATKIELDDLRGRELLFIARKGSSPN